MHSQFNYFIERVITFTKVGKKKGKEISLAVMYGEGALSIDVRYIKCQIKNRPLLQ